MVSVNACLWPLRRSQTSLKKLAWEVSLSKVFLSTNRTSLRPAGCTSGAKDPTDEDPAEKDPTDGADVSHVFDGINQMCSHGDWGALPLGALSHWNSL